MTEVSFKTVNEKLKESILFIFDNIDDLEGLGMKKLSKLLYFADFNHYKKHLESITGEDYIREDHGPIPESIYDVIDQLENEGKITARKKEIGQIEKWEFSDFSSSEIKNLTESEKEELMNIISKFDDCRASELEDLSHRDTPWQVTDQNDVVKYKLVFYRDDDIAKIVE